VTSGSAQPVVRGLPLGVATRELTPHRDERGSFTELFRQEWGVGVSPLQWNAVRTEAGVLRGVHVHPRHDDYLVVHMGRASVGLRDLRVGSPTEGSVDVVELHADRPRAIVIPHGVAHGFYFHESSVHIYAVSHYWDVEDELGCRWDDPDLGIPWPIETAKVSPRDADLPPLATLLAEADLAYEGPPRAPAG
jgi:dTDP-4-dehydrorhamnose 3,5-epimerase